MKTIIQSAAVLFAAGIILGSVTAFCDGTNDIWAAGTQNETPAGKVIPTSNCYTNNQQTVSDIQQTRVEQQGGCPKGAVLIHQNGPRVELRPPSAYREQNPQFEQQHLWDIDNTPPQSP
jgi:hypothetical protein